MVNKLYKACPDAKSGRDTRPDWTKYFMGLAFVASCRSHDAETKHGAIITDKNNIIVGTGYNGFVKHSDDAALPINRPDKYRYMIHAEENALLNCKVPPRELKGGAVIYVTGTPCTSCLQRCIQAGVTDFFIADRQGTKLEDDQSVKDFEFFVATHNLSVNKVPVDVDWLITRLIQVKENL